MFCNLTPAAALGLVWLALAVTTGSASEVHPLSTSAQQAAAHLAANQKAEGYWLTTYTSSTTYEQPRLEMNVFVTSMIVDLMSPVTGKAGLPETIGRARSHLADQLESNGLVRYHGRADAPTIPSLGCVISPDADDTALVWRLAGDAQAPLLPGVLELLRSYRRSSGLYHTWLAPRAEYRGIDPGTDPNPTDVGIQMHVLMFLAKFDPAAAHALYGALEQAVSEEHNWVYYRLAPLVPLLRQADLRRLHFPLKLPSSLAHSPVAGQAEWETACRLLGPYLAAERRPEPSAETVSLLRRIAADDFAAIRRNPPLFYHNDLSAHVRRFYWSEDFGYALWLRLYFEAMPTGTPAAAARNP